MIRVALKIVINEWQSRGHMGDKNHFTVFVEREPGGPTLPLAAGFGYTDSSHSSLRAALEHAKTAADMLDCEIVHRKGAVDVVIEHGQSA